MKEVSQKIKAEVNKQIAEAMFGKDWTDKQEISRKIESIKRCELDSHTITIFPGWQSEVLTQIGIQKPYLPQTPMTKTIKELKNILFANYSQKHRRLFLSIDIIKQAIKNVEEQGIIFIDQIDKIATPSGAFYKGKGVSTEGVQRDLLPIIEGTSVSTKYGEIKTDHILFIASGSFSMAKVDDLIPELLGRLPVRVALNPITLQEMVRILTELQYNLLMQQVNLFKAEGVNLQFTSDAIEKLAEISFYLNQNTQNIGARRLHTIVQKVLEDESFEASDKKGQDVVINKQYVDSKLQHLLTTINLGKFLI